MIYTQDCLTGLSQLDSCSVDTIITSPPYNKKGLLGKKGTGNQIWKKHEIDYDTYGDDMSEDDYQQWMINVLNECYRVLKDDGSMFFNHKPRRHNNRAYLPSEFIIHSDFTIYQLIIWDRRSSPNIRNDVLVPCTEHIYWLSKKKPRVYRDQVDIKYRSEVWVISADKQGQHPAPFPPQLVENCVLLTTQSGDLVVDPFLGSGTTAVVSQSLNRQWIGYEIDPHYVSITQDRLSVGVLPV